MSLGGKIALITGAGSGFGRGIAETFVAQDARVALLDINPETANEVAEHLGPNALAVTADVTERASLDHAINQVTAWAGGQICSDTTPGMVIPPPSIKI